MIGDRYDKQYGAIGYRRSALFWMTKEMALAIFVRQRERLLPVQSSHGSATLAVVRVCTNSDSLV